MPILAPAVRVDRDYLNETEIYVVEQFLYRLADLVNAATKAGAVYGQVILPPEEAARKRAATPQRGEGY